MNKSSLVGLVVIISQSVVTTIVLVCFSLRYFGFTFPYEFLLTALLYDVFAIVTHMLYRKYERGKRIGVVTKALPSRKGLTIFHATSSLLALFFAFYFIKHDTGLIEISFILISWLASFFSGIFLYIRKEF